MRPTVPRRWPAPRPRSGRRRRGLMGGGGGGGGGVAHGLSDFTNQSPALPALFTLPAISSISTPWGAAMGALLFPSLPSCPFLCRSPRHAASPCPCSPWCALHRPVRQPAPRRARERDGGRPTRLPPPPPPPAPAPPALRTTPRLQEKIPQALQPQLPVFVQGDRISGQTDLHTLVEGDAALRRGDTVIRADQLDYRRPEDLARARGRVRLNRAGNL